jgi:hypothetical protein
MKTPGRNRTVEMMTASMVKNLSFVRFRMSRKVQMIKLIQRTTRKMTEKLDKMSKELLIRAGFKVIFSPLLKL